MSNPVLQAFFLGRAFAEVLKEKVEDALTNALSELGKFDAEQRELLHQFIEEVQARASHEASQGTTDSSFNHDDTSTDLQATIDDLRAEIARLKAELKSHRN